MKEDFSSMENNEDLARLEQFVEKLIGSHNQLKKEKDEMAVQMQEKEQEIAELQEMIKSLQDDRSVVHSQVTGLIDRIGEWEKVFDQEGPGQESKTGDGQAQNLSEESPTLFNVATEQPL
jgi:predicted nuclease with TOPRIM domain